jgi:HEAT repeat protein
MVMFRDEVEPSKKALIEMGERAIPQMLTKLDTRSARETHTVVDIFKGIGEVAVPPLIKKLKSRDDYVRRLAIRCLGDIKSPKAIDELAKYADHNDFRTRSGVMHALGQIGDPSASYIVTLGLNDNDELVATSAAVACGKILEGIDPMALIYALSHSYYGVRYSAMNSLVKLGEKSLEPLIEYIETHPRDISVGYAIEALGKIGDKDGINALKKTMKSNTWTIRAHTAQALGEINQGKAEKILKKALEIERHPLVINKIKKSLAVYNDD